MSGSPTLLKATAASKVLRLSSPAKGVGNSHAHELHTLRAGLTRTFHAGFLTARSNRQPPRSTQTSSGASMSLFDGFTDRSQDDFAIGVLGDLHLEPRQMHLFNKAASQMKTSLSSAGKGSRLVQLGDLSGYNHGPGSTKSFQSALDYLRQFGMPTALVTGNHDLEGSEFETDEENLTVWSEVFGQCHYWAADLGRAVCLGLSTVRFRSNRDSVHEVFIDQEQLAWFEKQLQAASGRPVFVFTHAPPLGCGLRVVEDVHVKNRCAWLNHSNRPELFIELVRRFPNIKLWFSGHYHLSQNYTDSISAVGSCAFVQTAVIGECDRDGYHQSRIIRGNDEGFSVSTFNHASGEERLDIQQAWNDTGVPEVAWLKRQPVKKWPASLRFHQESCLDGLIATNQSHGEGESEASSIPHGEIWWGVGPGKALRRMKDGLIVEYNTNYRAAIGVVFMHIDRRQVIVPVDRNGQEVDCKATSSHSPSVDGSEVDQIQIRDSQGNTIRRVSRNAEGGFFQIFQQNKWRARRAKEAQARQEAFALP